MAYVKRAFVNPPSLTVEGDRMNGQADVRVVVGYFDENGIADPDSKLVHHVVCLYLQRNGKWQCNGPHGDPDAAHAPHPIWDGLLSAEQRAKVLADIAHAETTYGIRTHAMVEYAYAPGGEISGVGAKVVRYEKAGDKYERKEVVYPLTISEAGIKFPDAMSDVPRDVRAGLTDLVASHIGSRGLTS